MTDFQSRAKLYTDPEKMAQGYLRMYFADSPLSYPLNPFQMLKDAGILFSFRNFKNLEGVYIPASDGDDTAVVGINYNRPITRQRYTAVHELCHHFRDAEKEIACPSGSDEPREKFAESFAAAVLMPIGELKRQVCQRAVNGKVSLPAVLEIADHFGVSFDACVYRIAYKLYMLDGDTSPNKLRKRISKFAPEKQRRERGLTYAGLYADLIDSYTASLSFHPSDRARTLFNTNYIYNDSRMEGVDVTLDQAAEIVTDLRLHQQHSQYCNENNEPYLDVQLRVDTLPCLDITGQILVQHNNVYTIPQHRLIVRCLPPKAGHGKTLVLYVADSPLNLNYIFDVQVNIDGHQNPAL